jgi:hypothetical protein
MKSLRPRAVLAAVLAVLAFAAAGAVAQDHPTDADVAEIRDVIHRQIDALRRDDAAQAFALITPAARQRFDNPDDFLHAVQTTYKPILLSVSVLFLDPSFAEGDVMQQVLLADENGSVTAAYYVAQHQRDGSWRISGCVLVRTSFVST